jgi:exopolyphosphatase/guanosine-5'-triphosphate,3'-diphosphate pyrophosphatase
MQNVHRLAAVDLGSNSFRLEIGHLEQNQFYRSDYLKETIRLGNGLDDQCNLTQQAMQRGLECINRFGERLRELEVTHVAAVATQTLREACNRDSFLRPACAMLGFPIAVISGDEEARLIYQGVTQALSRSNERRLVIDIGGRSTELIVGTGLHATHMGSYSIGSVAWSMRYFPNGEFSIQAFRNAEVAAQEVLLNIQKHYSYDHWEVAYGSAGTVNAVADVLSAARWPQGFVCRDGLDWLLEQLLTVKTVDHLHLAGMRDDRKTIIGGGLSILRALFKLLNITRLEQANGGLRHGLLCDLAQKFSLES